MLVTPVSQSTFVDDITAAKAGFTWVTGTNSDVKHYHSISPIYLHECRWP
jgi:hypothetical protein